MKRLATTILAVVGLAGCFDDPTSSLQNGPSRLRLNVTQLFVAPAESVVVEGSILDDQGNTTPGQINFSSGDPAVALAGDLPADTLPGQIRSYGYVVGVAGGETYVRVTALGATDSIRVVTVPASFTGTVSANPVVGAPITLTAPALMTFNAASGVTVNGVPAIITGQTATTLSFASPIAGAGSVFTVTGALYLGSIALPDLVVATPITVTDPNEPGNDAPAGGATITLPTTVGGVVIVYGSTDPNDVDDFFTITPATGDSLQVEVFWLNTTIDIDGAVFNSGATAFAPGGNTGGTSADPEIMRVRLTAATTYRIYVNLYDDHGEATPVPYLIRITKRA